VCVPAAHGGRDISFIERDRMNASVTPPFRAEHIGSLLRPAALLALRQQYERGEIDRERLRAAEDQAIADAVDLQTRVGLGVATDGEFRRRSYHSYFYRRLGDIAPDAVGGEAAHDGGRGAQPTATVNSKLAWTQPIHVDDFKLLRAHTRAVPKITIPGPCAIHFRGGDAAVTAHAYRDVAAFWDDTVAAFRAELIALPMPAAPTCRSTRPRSQNSATPTCRRRSRRAATTGRG
jgi:5-methyltetrahydropteroyltriglutamate--homocysteine methyltransferase